MARSDASSEGKPSKPRTPRPHREPSHSPAADERTERTGFVQFIHECIAELRKVQWPTRPQLWQLTLVVFFVVIVIGVYIAALDSVLNRWSEWLIDQYATH